MLMKEHGKKCLQAPSEKYLHARKNNQMSQENIHPIFDSLVGRSEKESQLRQKGKVLWFTGLSGSGKSTIAQSVERRLFDQGKTVQVLDGDNIRTGICNNLSFTLEDRKENIRRIAEVSKLFCNSGIICINSFVSPTLEIRAMAKQIIGKADFIEIHVYASLEVCEERDVKGLYKKARSGQIKGFTGIDSPYEAPVNPDIFIDTTMFSVEKSTEQVLQFITNRISL